MTVENVGKYAKDNQIYKWEVVNLKRIKGSMALVFKMRLIRKNDINENWSTSQSMSTGSEGCLVVIISKGFYVHLILLTLEVFPQGTIHCVCMHYFFPYQAITTNES